VYPPVDIKRTPRTRRNLQTRIRLGLGAIGHFSVDTNHGFVLSTDLTPASVNDSIYLPHCIAASYHTADPIGKVYADKGYYGEPNSGFLHMNGIADGIMRKDTRSTKQSDYEKERNKGIS
jgi:transposase, IS5 family